MTSAKFLGYWTPSSLVRIWDWSTVLNSRNLPYYIFFWANPPPPSVRTSYMDAPWGAFHIWRPQNSRIFWPSLLRPSLAKMRPDESERTSAASLFTRKGCFVIFCHFWQPASCSCVERFSGVFEAQCVVWRAHCQLTYAVLSNQSIFRCCTSHSKPCTIGPRGPACFWIRIRGRQILIRDRYILLKGSQIR